MKGDQFMAMGHRLLAQAGFPVNYDVNKPSLPQIRSRRLDGVLYVRAADVADVLEQQAPGTNRPLIDKLRRAS